MNIVKGIPLDEFIICNEKEFPHSTGDLSKLLRDIGLAAKLINREVNKAGLVDILGSVGQTNVQGEEVQKLDEFANNQMIQILRSGGICAGVASEELDEVTPFENIGEDHKYVVLFDPLDGSSNIDVNVSIGTIFAIYRRCTQGPLAQAADFLQAGDQQVASGYVIYGSSTMLVYTTGNGVHGFTLDPSIGEFCLSHPHIRIPENGKIYSINQGSYHSFPTAVQAYIDYCLETDKATSRPYSMRYIGSMVADFHRNLIKGGIFIYPATNKDLNGKLRLLYECNPLSFIVEQAGGMSTNGKERILRLVPQELHQRCPIFIGSKNMVEKAMEFIRSEVKVAE